MQPRLRLDRHRNSHGQRPPRLQADVQAPRKESLKHLEIAGEGATDGDGSRQTDLWLAYAGLKEAAPNFAMARVARRADIYPVFRKLFARQAKQGTAQ